MKKKNNLSLYFHIPFCVSRCYYCDFYSTVLDDDDIKTRYSEAIIKSLETPEVYGSYSINTIYFGGGTPTALGVKNIAKILEKIRSVYYITKDCEITIETNPNCIGIEELILLKSCGINRISIGVQSFNDECLELLGRGHTSEDVFDFIELSDKSGFDNISIDLMFGLPDQSLGEFYKDLKITSGISKKVKHISLYNLRLEPETRLYNQRNYYNFLDDDAEAEMYYNSVKYLEDLGYKQYEISNFSKEGFHSRHNLNYWDCGNFLGFGASAHSRLEDKLFAIPADINEFIKGIEEGKNILDIVDYKSILPMSKEEIDAVYIMMSLRTIKGLEGDNLYHFDKFLYKAERFIKSGFLIRENNNFSISKEALFVSNPIISSLI